MESKSNSWLDAPVVRLIMMVVATVLLNFGLFPVLNFIAPLVSGIIIGFLVAKIRDGVAVSFLGTIISFSIVFVIAEWFAGFTTPFIDVVGAVLIMGGIGTAGGLIGSVISSNVRS
ncbi:MAG: hypothetical protein KGD60_02695 [Candidatus Thorarchaeota archaeon]|nr:hypothetical protein [Candidatus Thorarchaeota archaeon]